MLVNPYPKEIKDESTGSKVENELYKVWNAGAMAALTHIREVISNEIEMLLGGSSSYGLSETQLKILQLVSEGATNEEIAARLYISEATIKRHLQFIFTKMNVGSRPEAVGKALREGIIH